MVAAARPGPRGGGVFGIVGSILDIRDAIDDPTGAGPVGEIGRAVCDGIASTGFNNIPLANRTGPGYVCDGYWNQEGIDPPQDVSPFTGGQCPGVSYEVFINRNDEGVVLSPNLEGPIGGIVTRQIQNSAGTPGTGFFVSHGTPNQESGPIAFYPDGTTLDDWFISSVDRRDGQPDNCGDPDPVSEPGPSNPGTPYGSPVPFPGRPGVTITVQPPDIDPTGSPSWEVNIEVGGEPAGGPITFTPDGQPPAPSPPSEGDDVAGGSPSGESDDAPTPEEKEEGQELIGYTWNFPNIPANRGGVPGTNPLTYYEKFASIQLRLRDASGSVFYSPQTLICETSGSVVRQSDDLEVLGVTWNSKVSFGAMVVRPLKIGVE